MANVNQSISSKKPTSRELLVKVFDLMSENNLQLKLLNERFESIHNTTITLKDIENDPDNRL